MRCTWTQYLVFPLSAMVLLTPWLHSNWFSFTCVCVKPGSVLCFLSAVIHRKIQPRISQKKLQTYRCTMMCIYITFFFLTKIAWFCTKTIIQQCLGVIRRLIGEGDEATTLVSLGNCTKMISNAYRKLKVAFCQFGVTMLLGIGRKILHKFFRWLCY